MLFGLDFFYAARLELCFIYSDKAVVLFSVTADSTSVVSNVNPLVQMTFDRLRNNTRNVQ